MENKQRVLFLSVHDSVRWQMAEGFLRSNVARASLPIQEAFLCKHPARGRHAETNDLSAGCLKLTARRPHERRTLRLHFRGADRRSPRQEIHMDFTSH